jgi:hypothetical protein
MLQKFRPRRINFSVVPTAVIRKTGGHGRHARPCWSFQFKAFCRLGWDSDALKSRPWKPCQPLRLPVPSAPVSSLLYEPFPLNPVPPMRYSLHNFAD